MNENIKRLLRPIVKHRNFLERMKYRSTDVADEKSGNQLLAERLRDSIPSAIGKIGAAEMGGLHYYLKHRGADGECGTWGKHARLLHVNAGVYPAEPSIFSRFCREYMDAVSALDVVAVWYNRGESGVLRQFAPAARPVALTSLEPYYQPEPWSRFLAGKRVMVVSPFAGTIASQYEHRQAVWAGHPAVMPDFDLKVMRVPLSAGLVDPEFPDWFTALDVFRERISKSGCNVVIVGAGAWSLPLVAHAKREGMWGLHLGGPTQVLFGVKGARWETNPRLAPYYNDAWRRPDSAETPRTKGLVENGCYW